MTTVTHTAPAPQVQPIRSTLAVLAGFLTVVVLSLATDQLFHVLHVYPPWGDPMWDPRLNLLALTYRTVYTIGAGYLTAKLAPHRPARHAAVLGIFGLIGGIAGVIGTMNLELGPRWYPIAIAVTAFPCVWLGGRIAAPRE